MSRFVRIDELPANYYNLRLMSIFEISMLVCFGTAWPVSIYKSWRSRKTSGKSVLFLYVILLGYCAGIIHKFLYSFDRVLWLYILNAGMVFADIVLFYRNRRLERDGTG